MRGTNTRERRITRQTKKAFFVLYITLVTLTQQQTNTGRCRQW